MPTIEPAIRTLVSEALAEQLWRSPASANLYRSDAAFHAAVESARVAVEAVAESMWRDGIGYDVTRRVVAGAWARLVDDRELAAERMAATALVHITDAGQIEAVRP